MDARALNRGRAAMSSEEVSKRRCPRCQSERVQWSHSSGAERLLRFVGVGFFRCKHCMHRWPGLRGWGQKQTRIMILLGGVLLALLFVWGAILYLDPGRPE
jgi:hypothetical protein